MIYLELVTDGFEDVLEQQRAGRRSALATRDAGRVTARRPTRGLEIKEDRPASIKIIQVDGTELPFIDSGSATGETNQYTNFILQSVSEARMEKSQIVETFGDSLIFFFGEAPRFLDVQAVLINSLDFNWEAEWWENYQTNMRGTKLVERGARMYLFYDDNVVQGYMLNCQAVKSSDQPFLIQMSFRIFVTDVNNITFVGEPAYPIRASAVLPDSIDLTDPNSRFDLFSNQAGQSRDAALARNSADSYDLAGVDNQDLDSLYRQGALTRVLRAAPRSGSFPPAVVEQLNQQGISAIKAAVGNNPIRSLISDNIDEFIGNPANAITTSEADLPSAQRVTIQGVQEVDDLWASAIDRLSDFGLFLDSKALVDINLMPYFGLDVNASASFTASAGVSFGFGLTDTRQTNAQLARLRDQLSPSTYAKPSVSSLGSVYGSGSASVMINRSSTQGGGDREYGYDSSYGSGPGFGKPGFGDFGGNGFGSGQGQQGDPGFKSPSSFTFSGVAAEEAAFNRFNTPTRNNTVFGSALAPAGASGRIGLGASTAGLSGNAATLIKGKPSVFSITSLPGTLDITGLASKPTTKPVGIANLPVQASGGHAATGLDPGDSLVDGQLMVDQLGVTLDGNPVVNNVTLVEGQLTIDQYGIVIDGDPVVVE